MGSGTRQNCVGLGAYLALLLALIVLVPADRYPNWFSSGLGTLSSTFIAICW
jgi:hypothetical protein